MGLLFGGLALGAVTLWALSRGSAGGGRHPIRSQNINVQTGDELNALLADDPELGAYVTGLLTTPEQFTQTEIQQASADLEAMGYRGLSMTLAALVSKGR